MLNITDSKKQRSTITKVITNRNEPWYYNDDLTAEQVLTGWAGFNNVRWLHGGRAGKYDSQFSSFLQSLGFFSFLVVGLVGNPGQDLWSGDGVITLFVTSPWWTWQPTSGAVHHCRVTCWLKYAQIDTLKKIANLLIEYSFVNFRKEEFCTVIMCVINAYCSIRWNSYDGHHVWLDLGFCWADVHHCWVTCGLNYISCW